MSDPDETLMLELQRGSRAAFDATLLMLPLNTVRSRLFRARMALKQLLEPVQGMT